MPKAKLRLRWQQASLVGILAFLISELFIVAGLVVYVMTLDSPGSMAGFWIFAMSVKALPLAGAVGIITSIVSALRFSKAQHQL